MEATFVKPDVIFPKRRTQGVWARLTKSLWQLTEAHSDSDLTGFKGIL